MNILNKGINLTEIGINNFAYSWENINDILVEMENLNLIILGGDVYTIEGGKLCLTFDSWYFNTNNDLLDSLSSIKKAREFIKKYLEKNGKNFCFSFVLK